MTVRYNLKTAKVTKKSKGTEKKPQILSKKTIDQIKTLQTQIFESQASKDHKSMANSELLSKLKTTLNDAEVLARGNDLVKIELARIRSQNEAMHLSHL